MEIDKVEYVFDPFEETGLKKPKRVSKELKEDLKDFVLESVLDEVGATKSPVRVGGANAKYFPRLKSKRYKQIKKSKNAPPIPNLELEGKMLDQLKMSNARGNKLRLGIKGAQAPKADGHNNHSGDSKLPLRRFIPKKENGDKFKQTIINGMRQIIKEHEE